jgi:hypothetical protein
VDIVVPVGGELVVVLGILEVLVVVSTVPRTKLPFAKLEETM